MMGDRGFTERTRAEIALRESEERFRAIFETARDCVFVKDRDLRYTHVNPAMAALFDATPAALVGVTDDVLFDAATCARVREVDLRVLQGRIENDVSTSRVHGIDHVFHTVKVPLRDGGGAVVGVCGIARDVTELTRAEAVERTMAAILRAAVTTSDLRTLIAAIRETLGGLIDTKNFFVALYDEAGDRYRFPYFADQFDVTEPDSVEALPKSLTDYVRRIGKPTLVNSDDFATLQAAGEVELVGTDSVQWLGAPLTRGTQVIGVVAVQSYDDPHLYSERDINLFGYAAGTISIAIDRAQRRGGAPGAGGARLPQPEDGEPGGARRGDRPRVQQPAPGRSWGVGSGLAAAAGGQPGPPADRGDRDGSGQRRPPDPADAGLCRQGQVHCRRRRPVGGDRADGAQPRGLAAELGRAVPRSPVGSPADHRRRVRDPADGEQPGDQRDRGAGRGRRQRPRADHRRAVRSRRAGEGRSWARSWTPAAMWCSRCRTAAAG